eukprot:scaffold96549_cov60-Phaeocystis_antarctica.AAC.4
MVLEPVSDELPEVLTEAKLRHIRRRVLLQPGDKLLEGGPRRRRQLRRHPGREVAHHVRGENLLQGGGRWPAMREPVGRLARGGRRCQRCSCRRRRCKPRHRAVGPRRQRHRCLVEAQGARRLVEG